MKQLSLVKKIIFLLNIVAAFLLLISFMGSYVSVKSFPFFSLLNLAIPLLVVVNVIFVLYWIFTLKKQILLSLVVLVLGYFVMDGFYKHNQNSDKFNEESISILSFNTRYFNYNKDVGETNIDSLIVDLVKNENPDIVCFQEFHYSKIRSNDFQQYPYKYVDFVFGKSRSKAIQAIYSKYPLVAKGSLDFPKSANNGIYADILYKKDTIRVYNLHLQSFSVIPSVNAVLNEPKDRLYKRMSKSFAKQEEQVNLFLEHSKTVSYKKIVCGDFNNNQYSKVYRTIKGSMVDTFEEKGNGFGRTLDFMGYPLRIDFILADSKFEVLEHKNYNEKLSDHYPVMARLKLTSH